MSDLSIFERFVNEEIEATNGPRLIEGSFTTTITEIDFHIHQRRVIVRDGLGVLYCPVCDKEYRRYEISTKEDVWLEFDLEPTVEVDEGQVSGGQILAIFMLSYVSMLTVLAIGQLLVERLL